MPEVSTACFALNCKFNCDKYVPGPMQGHFTVCANCFHTKAVHKNTKDAADKPQTPVSGPSTPKPRDYVVKNSPAVTEAPSVSHSVDGALTPKAMRAWLISQGVAGVGERGRLKPEHIAMATKGLSNG